MNKKLCAASILAAAALWGCIGVFLRGMTDLGLSSMQAMSARTVFAAVVLLPVLWFRDRSLLRLERLSDLRYFFGTGVLSLLFFNWCYFGAIKASSMSVAAVLLYTSPIFVVLLSAACFGERVTRRKALALCCTFAGCCAGQRTAFAGGGNRTAGLSPRDRLGVRILALQHFRTVCPAPLPLADRHLLHHLLCRRRERSDHSAQRGAAAARSALHRPRGFSHLRNGGALLCAALSSLYGGTCGGADRARRHHGDP